MNILYISNHLSLPDEPGAPRPWKVALYLHLLGHEVTVITNRRHYFDENISFDRARYLRPQVIQGVKIVGVETTPGRRKSLTKRLFNYFSFSFMSYWVGKKLNRPDIIIVGTPPLIVPLTGWLLGKKFRASTILEVRDLFPETAVSLGKVKRKEVVYFWELWENFLRKRYDHIVAVVPGIKEALLKKGFPKENVTTITNGFDIEQKKSCTLPYILKHFFQEQSDRFIVVYGGGMGYGNNLFTIVQAAELCSNDKNLVFAFFGEGEQKREYVKYVKQKGLKNIFFFPPQQRLVINQVFRLASALVHSFSNSDLFRYALPNKIFEYHGAGKPIVFAGKGDTADLIRMAGSGIVVEPENPQEMAQALRHLAANPEKARSMGEAGLVYIQKHYQRQVIFLEWANVLEKATSK